MSASKLVVRLLGTGSSGGVPRINGDWGVCDPSNPRNRRSRCSLLISKWTEGQETPTRVLIDTSPEMRNQLIDAKASHLDAVLYSHDHADQSHGIDDLRTYALTMKRRMPVYLDESTFKTLSKRFAYCFEGFGPYPSILDARVELKPLHHINIEGPGGDIGFLALDQDHGSIRSLGFRFGEVAYCNDVVDLPETSLEQLYGLKLFIVDALRYKPHPTHAHLEKSLQWIERLKPKRALLTNLHIDMDYDRLHAELPDHVEPAYDGMEIATEI